MTKPLVDELNLAEVTAERDFLLARIAHRDVSWVGISSTAMVHAVISGTDMPKPFDWPHDAGDLSRCEKTYLRAPDHLKPRMRPILDRYRRHIVEGGLYCRGCDNSIGHWSTRDGLCPACWEQRVEKNPEVER